MCLIPILLPPAALLLVFLALVFTVSLASIDERIQLYSVQPDLWYTFLTTLGGLQIEFYFSLPQD